MTNVLLAANHANSIGAAVVVTTGYALRLQHVTIVSPTLGNLEAFYLSSGTLDMTNTIVSSYTVGLKRENGTVRENYNLFSAVATPYVGGITGGDHSLTGPAAFYNHTGYTLTASSAAIDVGANAGVPSDYFGTPRPQGLGFDMGYAEAPSGLAVWRYYLPFVRR